MTNSERTNIEQRGKVQGRRLQQLRSLTGLTRNEICLKYSNTLVFNTYKGWETGAYDKLSKKALSKIREVYSQEGIIYNDNWLADGAGIAPIRLQKDNQNSSHPVELDDQLIVDDLYELIKRYDHAIVTVLQDDCMSPKFVEGDYVAGIMQGSHFEKFLGHDCIIETTTGDLLVRHIHALSDKETYTLTPLNPNAKVKEPILYNVEIKQAGKIKWHIIKDRAASG